MKLRPWIFWPHLIAGVTTGLVILLMCVTGVLLTYERQMIAWADREFRSAPPSPGAEPLAADRLLQAFRDSHDGVAATTMTVGSAADAPVAFAAPGRVIYLDAYTGGTLGEGSRAVRTFMSELRAWHRWIAVDGDNRPIARAITGWSNAVFLFIVVSGFYLWFPRKWTWTQVRAVAWFKGGLRGKARDFNWHNAIGVWSAVPLFIVVLSAMPISFPWANALVYRMVGEQPPAPAARPAAAGAGAAAGDRNAAHGGDAPLREANLEALLTRAEAQVEGWRTIAMRVPDNGRGPIAFTIDRGDGGQPHLRATLNLSRSGEVVSYEPFSALTLGRRIRNTMRFAHTGEVLGIPGQTLAGIVTAGGAVLVWTGLALAWRRWRSWTKRRRDRADVLPEQHSTAA